MFDPVSTYRIQFHKEFTFNDFKGVIPYLHDLGVKTIYASPIFAATAGSNHGYDVTDPHRINPEIGTPEELEEISQTLKNLGMNWLQDIVPNHMAFHPDNAWLSDVLEKGEGSIYARHFDILWDLPGFDGKLMVPFLGEPLDEMLNNGKIQLAHQPSGLSLTCDGQSYPLNLASCIRLLKSGSDHMPARLAKMLSEIEANGGKQAMDHFGEFKALISQPAIQHNIGDIIASANQDPGLLQQIVDEQHYRLSYWKESDTAINYRRFFTVNGLICLNIQDPEVFDHYHRFIKELLNRGIFQGLRVDHIDGLYDPAGYLENLRRLAGDDVYIVVEKILESGEQFPGAWPVQGNTGYDFLALVNNLLTSAQNGRRFSEFFRKEISPAKPVFKAILEKKSAILFEHMGGELDNLVNLFKSLGHLNKIAIADDVLKSTIAEFLIRCPVYRYYGNRLPLPKAELEAVNDILNEIKKAKPALAAGADLLGSLFGRRKNDPDGQAALRFYQRCMQFTGPLMAKGVEDTLMYTDNHFIGHNEVGDSPDAFGLEIARFHQLMVERQAQWPHAVNGTATHDTKRGEDVRARLNVLTEMPDEWMALVQKWQEHYPVDEGKGPDANDAYLIYQTLAGIVPPPGQPEDNLAERLPEYLTKALREAKTHSQWAEPNAEYEKETIDFAADLLKPTGYFWRSLQQWQERIEDNFVLNSLVQVLLKFTCPGVPDIYQGCELWDFSLVDPDNRRPVNYTLREKSLERVRKSGPAALWQDRHDGSLKLWLTDKLLHQRLALPRLYAEGSYIPLTVTGKYSENVIAFGRRHLRQWMIVVAPLHLARISEKPFPDLDWEDTAILLPEDAPVEWINELSGEKSLYSAKIPLSKLLSAFPLALLTSANNTKRTAGIIQHITSLPSPYGIGDLGPEARRFADFLADADQTYWQLLPVNPTGPAAGYSPYSASSSMAGHTLLISPDDLVSDGLLELSEIAESRLLENETADFEKAFSTKAKVFQKAFDRFNAHGFEELKQAFSDFKDAEQAWLNDFTLYDVLKSHHHGDSWYLWPEALKLRDQKALKIFSADHLQEIEYSKWLQFIFFRQWEALKSYSNQAGIRLFGDLPFYVSYDSADVWTHPDLFSLDNEHNMLSSGGVPPDYFNADGQHWGMPVYRWDKLRKSGFKWWVERIKKNRTFFDVIRLDHFRAFYDYWEVPAKEPTAVNGEWKLGPGAEIFRAFEKALGELPFIAEDLGEVSPGVYQLRDEIGLPGMNLLQYGFGADMPVSVHAPHNHLNNSVTYTGTHDNNTTKGWFKTDATLQEKQNLEKHLRVKLKARNVTALLVELCYASPAFIAIVPLQDLMDLDTGARMNLPSSAEGNWRWRLKRTWPAADLARRLRQLVRDYHR